MLLLANFAASLGLLLPVLFFVGLRSSRRRELWEIGLDIPLAVALDLLFVLCLTWVMPLETATLVARALYMVACVAVFGARWRARRPLTVWPAAVDARALFCLGTATLVALVISMWMSRTYVIWDRPWHIPLVTSLRGQRLPFRNVFNAHEVLHYHFAGDVEGAMLQTLSCGVLHASLALTLAHDLWFSLAGLTLGCFMAWWGYRRVGAFALGTALMLFTGPTHIFKEGVRVPQEGHSLNSWLSYSFRPALSLSGLFMLGFVGAMVARLGNRDDLPLRKTAPALCVCTAAMALTDETSLGMLGLALGVTWLFAPRVLHESRKVGVIVLAALLAAIVVPSLLFAASLAPGGQHHVWKLVPWRSPGYYREVLPLTQPRGRTMLLLDLLGSFAVGLGGVLHALTRRARGRGVLAAYLAVLLAVSVVGFSHIEVDSSPVENHRFVLALMVTGPFVAMALFSPRFPATARAHGQPVYATAIMVVGMTAATASTVDWGFNFAPNWCSRHHDFGTYNFYETNCRTVVGGSTRGRPAYTYLSPSLYYLASGCVSTFTPGQVKESAWKALTIGVALQRKEEIAAIRKELPPSASIPLVCPVVPDNGDPICIAAEKSGSCKRMGQVTKSCSLTAAQAARLAK